jgi:3-oxoacyl-[acyl-carrier-protein] synthase II
MVTPVGLTAQESWKNILAGNTGVGTITQFDASNYSVHIAAEVKNFDPMQFMDHKEARKSTRFIQFAVAAAKEALADSGLDLRKDTTRYGCAIGVGIGSMEDMSTTSIAMHEGGFKKVSPFFIPYVITNMAAGIVANTYSLKGPNICPTTACTSGTHAVGEGFLYIKNGMADVMLCGGSEAAICQVAVYGFGNMKALSRNNSEPKLASRPFDKDRDGFVIGEGAGLLVLEEYEHAKARGAKIYAEVRGYGMSADAYHITLPSPHGEGAARCMAAALKSANIEAKAVSYINAHGTSTYYNDMYESEAISTVFGEHAHKLAVSSTKGVTGHCLGAAGGIEAAVLAKSIQEGVIPPTAGLREAGAECPLDYVPGSARKTQVGAALSNSFGFGGTNGTIVMTHLDYFK